MVLVIIGLTSVWLSCVFHLNTMYPLFDML